jgi:hypothetical protein
MCKGTDQPADHTDTFTQSWEHTQRCVNMIPLPYSEEMWLQTLATHQHRDRKVTHRHKHMHTYFSLVYHAKDKRVESLAAE